MEVEARLTADDDHPGEGPFAETAAMISDGLDFFAVGRSPTRSPTTFGYQRRAPPQLDGDAATDGGDLGIFFTEWERCETRQADLDGGGVADGMDPGIFLAVWGWCFREDGHSG